MKKNILKIVLPAFALLLAVSFAFATEESNAAQTGYINHPIFGVIQIMTDCDNTSSILCKENGLQVYSDPGLQNPLKERLQ